MRFHNRAIDQVQTVARFCRQHIENTLPDSSPRPAVEPIVRTCKDLVRDMMQERPDKPKTVDTSEAQPRYWMGSVPEKDDFGDSISDEFIDGATQMGPWATMTPRSWMMHGVGRLGTGSGQRYEKQADGKWLKVGSRDGEEK